MARPLSIFQDKSFEEHAAERVDIVARAHTAGVRAATDGFKLELRQAIVAAGLGQRLPNAVGSAVYPKGKNSIGAAGTVFARGARADLLLSVQAKGAVIRGKGGKYLAIPTRAAGRTVDGKPMTPAAWQTANNQDLHVARASSGALVLIAYRERLRRGRGGRYVGRERPAGFAVKNRQNYIVLFFLVRVATLRGRFDPDELARKWGDRVADLIARATPPDL